MTPAFHLRAAHPADVAVIAALFTELGYPSSPAEMAGRLPRILDDAGSRILLAETTGGAVIGCIHVGLLAILERDLSAQIMGLVVASTHRRRGVGRALITAAEQWARDQGGGTMYVRTNIIRPDAPAFYTGLGYINTKTQLAFRKNLRASA